MPAGHGGPHVDSDNIPTSCTEHCLRHSDPLPNDLCIEQLVSRHGSLHDRLPPLPAWPIALVIVLTLAAGIGLRDPSPADEPRFVLAAQQMIESGQWLFPQRGSELYPDKPPMFMWLIASAYQFTGNWRVAFLLPSLLAALLTLACTWDLGRRLWNPQVGIRAALALFVCLQFGLQARRAQIDMVLVGMTTLSLWALLRLLLADGGWRQALLGGFAAGLGTITKGVGFLPLLALLPWGLDRLRQRGSLPAISQSPRRWLLLLVPGFLIGVGLWLLPMLSAVHGSTDPALQAYADNILWKQTGTRYLDAWHHHKPAWYYLQVMLTLWLPGALLLPWLLPHWWRAIRRGDRRLRVLLGWGVLVLLFFSLSPGKRDVYLFPALPAFCLAAAPVLGALLKRSGIRHLLLAWLLMPAALSLLLAGLIAADHDGLSARVIRQGLDPEILPLLRAPLLVLAIGLCSVAAVFWRRGPGIALVLATALAWMVVALAVEPALSDERSAHRLMRHVGERIGPDAELGLVAWREQLLLQADRPTADFGFSRPWPDQWLSASHWLAQAPSRRWLLVLAESLDTCVDRERTVAAGRANRRDWLLVPGTAWRSGCVAGNAVNGEANSADD